MRRSTWLLFVSVFAMAVVPSVRAQDKQDGSWTSDFALEKDDLSSTGRNPYFVLEAGYQLILEGGDTRLVVTVLNETKIIDGIEARVVEERETKNDQMVELSRNYFAISRRTNSVFYCGEDVDMYRDGKVTGHEGSWAAGKDGATCGLMMPGLILLKGRYYQERAPGIAMDRAEIASLNESVKTPAGEFKHSVKVTETTPLEFLNKEHKYYVSGIGLVQDGSLKLVKYGKVDAVGN